MPISDVPVPNPPIPAVAEVVVQAPRLPPALGDAAFSIRTLTRAELEAPPRLDEALSEDPGVSLFRRNSSLAANPTTQGISLRSIAGSGASRALVTLDGAPINDPFGGWVIWSALAPEAIQSADLVKGAGAGPYGAGALTGTVELRERTSIPGGFEAETSGGTEGDARGEAAGLVRLGSASLLGAVSAESSDGFFAVRQGRGAADTRLTLRDAAASTRFTDEIDGGVLAGRVGLYREARGAGLVGAASRAEGLQTSLAYAHAPGGSDLGWRVQVWANASDLANSSVSVAASRASTTPANDEYATPTTEVGANAAVQGRWVGAVFELGVDLRTARGRDDELFKWSGAAFADRREVGGQTGTAGLYLEASRRSGPWLFTGGLRLDGWGEWNGERIESVRATGLVTLDQGPSDRFGASPTGRLGLRRNLIGPVYARAAAYVGFRPATLNELYRTFRVGNSVTEADAALNPERLYGAEAAVGDEGRRQGWEATVFYNQIEDAVANVTIRAGPFTDPLEGFIPAGGVLYRRENAGTVRAPGFEGNVHRALGDALTVRAAVSWTDAEIDGGQAAPQLTGKRPAETPRFAATVQADWRPLQPLRLRLELRDESARFADDQNQLRLAPDTVVNLRADWRLTPRLALFAAADNLFDAGVQTDRTAPAPGAPSVVSWGAPAVFRFGIVAR